jgi:nucleoside-diphosphate-sugar epimerase
MRVFVAGATGVLGRKSVELLAKAGHEVRGSARGEDKVKLLRSVGATPVTVDLFDAAAVREAIAGSDAVLHLATKIPPIMRMRSGKAWNENNRLRREATKHLVDGALAARAQVFVQESITFIYADSGEGWVTEETPVKPAWPAALDSTLDMEREARRFGDSGGRAVILRFGLFYAPYAQSTLDSVKMMRRRMFGIIGKGGNYFSSIHVDDAAAAIVAALDAPSGIYNVADDEPVTQAEYAMACAEEFGTPKPRRFPRWLGKLLLGGPANYILQSHRVSNKRFKEATGWAPQYPSVREGFKATAAALSADSGERVSGSG